MRAQNPLRKRGLVFQVAGWQFWIELFKTRSPLARRRADGRGDGDIVALTDATQPCASGASPQVRPTRPHRPCPLIPRAAAAEARSTAHSLPPRTCRLFPSLGPLAQYERAFLYFRDLLVFLCAAAARRAAARRLAEGGFLDILARACPHVFVVMVGSRTGWWSHYARGREVGCLR